jgi:hypothetical protein
MKQSVTRHTIDLETFVDVSPIRYMWHLDLMKRAMTWILWQHFPSCAFPERSKQLDPPAFLLPAMGQGMVTVENTRISVNSSNFKVRVSPCLS